MQAMIFAAGLGTRLQPLTNHCPKALVPLAGRPLIDHVLDKLVDAGATRIVVNVHHFADMLCRHLSQWQRARVELLVSDERDLLLDTGGGVRKALDLIDTTQPLLLHNVDIVSTSSLLQFVAAARSRHEATSCEAALMVSHRTSSRYLLFDSHQRMQGWTNTSTGAVRPEGLPVDGLLPRAFSGIHMLFPKVYPLLQAWPERFGITDFYIDTCRQHSYVAVDTPADTLIDVGTPERLQEAERQIARRQTIRH